MPQTIPDALPRKIFIAGRWVDAPGRPPAVILDPATNLPIASVPMRGGMSDGPSLRTFRREVQVGMIGVNVPIPVPTATFPFTDWRDSFFGTLHAYGPDEVEFCPERKIVTERWFARTDEGRARG